MKAVACCFLWPTSDALCWCAAAVTKSLDPSPEEVDEVQEKLLAALVALFDEHKHLLPGWENKTLEIA